jgi:hypothetical protein
MIKLILSPGTKELLKNMEKCIQLSADSRIIGITEFEYHSYF